jgi:hypothetical protein
MDFTQTYCFTIFKWILLKICDVVQKDASTINHVLARGGYGTKKS